MRARLCVAALLAAASFPLQAHDDSLEIVTLSNRADLVSGGDALLEVRLPRGTSLSRVKLKLNGDNVTSSFQAVSGGRALRGLVSGLVQGRNDFVAEIDERHGRDRRAHLVITNHPIGGPVLSGPQITPYFCATPTPQPATRRPRRRRTRAACRASQPGRNATSLRRPSFGTGRPQPAPLPLPAAAACTLPDANNPPANACFKPYTPGACPVGHGDDAHRSALHRARRARHDEPRHLRHRRAVRSDQALDVAAPRRRRSGTARSSTSSAPRPGSRDARRARSPTGPTKWRCRAATWWRRTA